jgi:DNA adenine methylase
LAKPIAHPIPYQGSKRKLASQILPYFPKNILTLYEPFSGSAAISLAALSQDCVESVHLNDVLAPLMCLWRGIAEQPQQLADRYETLWQAQLSDPRRFYLQIRDEFNHDHAPVKLLYLLTRCVKNAVRFNSKGEFNQSADHRRLGRKPDLMRKQILGAGSLLKNRLNTSSIDYEALLIQATDRDLIYMDPPYQGTSQAKDPRYVESLDLERFIENIESLLIRSVPFIISFDGRCGDKEFGPPLPESLGLRRIEICAGISSQATLNGQKAMTYESLYLSPEIRRELSPS